jgi:hypothetical protein
MKQHLQTQHLINIAYLLKETATKALPKSMFFRLSVIFNQTLKINSQGLDT